INWKAIIEAAKQAL
uniref:Protopolybia-mastoparan-II n=1 Tax=Protopolybia exigua TaxID=91439 RepID=MAST2_PROEX|nr:RecName: Full=Protopolybia-mastoparan-II; Short=Protopolybia-MP-II; Short=Protopolybia-MPII [Protopolybia exigua]